MPGLPLTARASEDQLVPSAEMTCLDRPFDRRRPPQYTAIWDLTFDMVTTWDANEVVVCPRLANRCHTNFDAHVGYGLLLRAESRQGFRRLVRSARRDPRRIASLPVHIAARKIEQRLSVRCKDRRVWWSLIEPPVAT